MTASITGKENGRIWIGRQTARTRREALSRRPERLALDAMGRLRTLRVAGVDSLRLLGALSRDELARAVDRIRVSKRIRVDLHFAAGRSQDVLVRDEQLRIAEERQIGGTIGQRPVERFMQSYFRHSTDIADLSAAVDYFASAAIAAPAACSAR